LDARTTLLNHWSSILPATFSYSPLSPHFLLCPFAHPKITRVDDHVAAMSGHGMVAFKTVYGSINTQELLTFTEEDLVLKPILTIHYSNLDNPQTY
jgi:hypothetical protein